MKTPIFRWLVAVSVIILMVLFFVYDLGQFLSLAYLKSRLAWLTDIYTHPYDPVLPGQSSGNAAGPRTPTAWAWKVSKSWWNGPVFPWTTGCGPGTGQHRYE